FMVMMILSDHTYSQSITWLGTLGGSTSVAYDVSSDGSVVVGSTALNDGTMRAFRWIDSTGIQNLDTIGAGNSSAYGVSADGSVVAGDASLSGHTRAFRWMDSTGLVGLETLDFAGSFSRGISDDGSIIVGYAQNALLQFRAFIWSNINTQFLNTLGGNRSVALGISRDGDVIVGESLNSNGQTRAFLINTDTTLIMVELGTLGGNSSVALSAGLDGSVIVGYSTDSDEKTHAFRWNFSNGMQDLGTLGGDWSQAYDVTKTNVGDVVVGQSPNSSGQIRAFRWMNGVMQDLNEIYTGLLSNGSLLKEARAITPDGRYIVGSGNNAATGRTEAFLLDTEISTSVENSLPVNLPDEFSLQQNYPNPFNPSTTISWQSPVGSHQTLKVFDVLGNEVATLVNEYREAGRNSVTFDASQLSSGVYIYKITAGEFSSSNKMLLLK
ncbi:MAG: T9SS type A sorting domain-containing protein, partial [Ignavibacteriaceae bacterium]